MNLNNLGGKATNYFKLLKSNFIDEDSLFSVHQMTQGENFKWHTQLFRKQLENNGRSQHIPSPMRISLEREQRKLETK